ncbi:MAG: putative uracil-DNA glycosylase, partial [Rhodospirillaceae bacterium]
RDSKGGDRPPRPECAPLWHPPLRAALPVLALTLLVGRHAQIRYLGPPCPGDDDGRRGGLAKLFTRLVSTAAPKLAQHSLVEAQSMVRCDAAAGLAAQGARGSGTLTFRCDGPGCPHLFRHERVRSVIMPAKPDRDRSGGVSSERKTRVTLSGAVGVNGSCLTGSDGKKR